MEYDCSQTIDEPMCELHKQGYEYLQQVIMSKSDDVITTISTMNSITDIGVQESLNMIGMHTEYIVHLLFFIVVFAVVYVIIKWLLKLISDVALGW